MNASSSESHPVATNADSRQATGQGQELTRVGRFFAAAGVCVPGGRTAGGGGGVKAVVAVVVAALLLAGLVVPAGGSSVRGAFANLRVVSSVPGELTISWDLPDPQPSDYRIMWAEEGLGFLSYRFANEALRGNEYPDGEALSVTLTGLTEGATYRVKARSRYSSGGWNNSRWSGPWSNEVTASVSVAAPVAQEPDDDSADSGQRRAAAGSADSGRGSADSGQRRAASRGSADSGQRRAASRGSADSGQRRAASRGSADSGQRRAASRGLRRLRATTSSKSRTPQTQGNDEQQVEDSADSGQRASSKSTTHRPRATSSNKSTTHRPRATTTSRATTRLWCRVSLLRPARRCLRMA